MNRGKNLWRAVLCAVSMLVCGASAWSQKTPVASRVMETVSDTKTVVLKGNVHPLARAEFDQGAVADSQPMTRMMLLLQRSSTQELALKQLIDAQQTKNSGSYHAWLTPEQFGAQFGPSDSDVQAVTDWLTRQGFQVAGVAKGKTIIEFSGNAGQVRNAFHTEIHKYAVNGKEHFANASDPEIPEALSPVVAGVVALHNFEKHPYIRHNGLYRRTKGSSQLEPLFTYGNPAKYAIGPGDFNTIYNVPSTATGAGQSIAIVAQTNINTDDIKNFRSMFNLPAYSSVCTSNLPPTCQFSVIINGTDPGILGPDSFSDDEIESDLDSEWAGAVAPAANVYLIVSQGTLSNPNQVSQGVDLSALFAVDSNVAPIISYSYGACEFGMGTAGNQFYNALWEQAAAQGISVAVATGDNGSAACDPDTSVDANAASQGVAVAGTATTPYAVAVGGTDFDPSTTANTTYWAANTSGDVVNSAVKYIPEITWDNSTCAYNYPATCSAVDTTSYAADISAGSGGPSNCTVSTTASCTSGYAKPAFQMALTPADGARDIPDISFFASNGGPLPPTPSSGISYVICQSDTNPQGSTTPTGASCNIQTPYADFSLVGGTSAATPVFAGVMALVDQATNERQGNPNYVLYNLAGKDANYTGGKCVTSTANSSTGTPLAPAAGCTFNDVNKGNNSVACDAGSPNCSNTSGTTASYGVLVCGQGTTPKCANADNGAPAFQSGTGYDLATGIGSINVGNLLTKWTSAIRTPTTTTLTNANGGSPSGTAFTATVTVSPAAATGNVSFSALDASGNILASFGTDSSGSGGKPFALSGGTATVTSSLLPPDTVSVEATYGGDANYAVSTSTPLPISQVQGTNSSSKVTVYFVSLGPGNIPNSNPTTGAQNFQYGVATGYILQIVVTGSNGTACAFQPPNTKPAIPCPTGTVTLLDNGNPLNDFLNNGTATNTTKLNNQGFAEDQPILLNAGSHSITATYTSGDSNYTSTNSSNSLSVTVTQAATSVGVSSSASTVPSGTSVTLTAVVNTQSTGNGPTGTVTFTSNGNTLGSPTCSPTAATSSTPASCTATLTTAISSLYPPPSTKPETPAIPRIPALIALLSLLLFLFALRFIPRKRRRAYAFAGLLAIALIVGVVAGCGGGGGGGGGGGTRTISANYSGDTNYTKSSGTTSITVQ